MDRLIERAQAGTPLVEGEQVTFVWQGTTAPHLIGDFSNWEWGAPLALTRVAPEVWAHTITLPGDAYMEYAFWDGESRLVDPLNPHTTPDGLGHIHSYFYMPEAAPTPLTRRRRNVPHGTVTRHQVTEGFFLVGGKRPLHLYRPAGNGAVPLLVVLDGQDYRRRAHLVNIVDTLIAQGRIQPVALAMIDHGRQARGIEYACSDAHLAVLIHEVLPLAQQELNLLDVQAQPGAYGILGASMGGLMALYAGLRAPHLFGRVLSQSGAFTLDDYDTVIWDLVRHGPQRPIRVWMVVGRYEWLLDCNRPMQALLQARGYDLAYHEYNGGHNYPSWRNLLPQGLAHLFGR